MHMAPRAIFFFFNDTATTEIYTLSLHDALPICDPPGASAHVATRRPDGHRVSDEQEVPDRRDAREHRARHVHDRHDVRYPSRSQLLDHDDEPPRERRLPTARRIGPADPELGLCLRRG